MYTINPHTYTDVDLREIVNGLLPSLIAAQCDVYPYAPDQEPEGEDDFCDFRVRLTGLGFEIKVGDASYDQDHRGYWGCSSFAPNDDAGCLYDALSDAVEQALDQCAQDYPLKG